MTNGDKQREMLLKNLFVDFPYPIPTTLTDAEISGIAIDSRAVKPGYLFVAMQGEFFGHGDADQVNRTVEFCDDTDGIAVDLLQPARRTRPYIHRGQAKNVQKAALG